MRGENRFRQRNFHCTKNKQRDKTFFGLMVVGIGVLFMLLKLDVLPWDFLYSKPVWPWILIVIGIFIGIKNRFSRSAWWILILIGAVNLKSRFEIWGHSSSDLVWPFMLIIVGLAIAFRSRKPHPFAINQGSPISPETTPPGGYKQSPFVEGVISSESNLNIDVVFGGRKEIVTSKDFKGGVISATFGGCEVNMIQADTTGQTILLVVKVSFGGVELIVPSHWDIENEINPAFGSVEDERTIQTNAAPESKKTLILRGSVSFGSIEIKSY